VTNVFLGVIAAAVLVMAGIQVAAVVLAARAARRIDHLAERIERDLQPVVANLSALTGEAARATALATAQVERVDRLFIDLAEALKGWLSIFRDLKTPGSGRKAGVEDDDALFIG
jgi:hypothetical protein